MVCCWCEHIEKHASSPADNSISLSYHFGQGSYAQFVSNKSDKPQANQIVYNLFNYLPAQSGMEHSICYVHILL